MESTLLEPTLYVVKAMAILDNDGNRILAKVCPDLVSFNEDIC
ncbi:unnamed protein product [Oppiella nova]|uniref:Uncharacterized protein n=1 Tax=Oppiella nova TaxID=334625 RepID=A0A7R9MAQ3_9ACAR|nr:unnamed protein product [Oppiella nova]CAG2173905.1 unnamed protein product [Oppiella nova]